MKSNEEIYRRALEKIAALTVKIAENFQEEDDEMSHYLEKVYDILSEVDAV